MLLSNLLAIFKEFVCTIANGVYVATPPNTQGDDDKSLAQTEKPLKNTFDQILEVNLVENLLAPPHICNYRKNKLY